MSSAPKTESRLPDPATGGRYRRKADGALEQLHATLPAEGRAKRKPAPAHVPAVPAIDTKE